MYTRAIRLDNGTTTEVRELKLPQRKRSCVTVFGFISARKSPRECGGKCIGILLASKLTTTADVTRPRAVVEGPSGTQLLISVEILVQLERTRAAERQWRPTMTHSENGGDHHATCNRLARRMIRAGVGKGECGTTLALCERPTVCLVRPRYFQDTNEEWQGRPPWRSPMSNLDPALCGRIIHCKTSAMKSMPASALNMGGGHEAHRWLGRLTRLDPLYKATPPCRGEMRVTWTKKRVSGPVDGLHWVFCSLPEAPRGSGTGGYTRTDTFVLPGQARNAARRSLRPPWWAQQR